MSKHRDFSNWTSYCPCRSKKHLRALEFQLGQDIGCFITEIIISGAPSRSVRRIDRKDRKHGLLRQLVLSYEVSWKLRSDRIDDSSSHLIVFSFEIVIQRSDSFSNNPNPNICNCKRTILSPIFSVLRSKFESIITKYFFRHFGTKNRISKTNHCVLYGWDHDSTVCWLNLHVQSNELIYVLFGNKWRPSQFDAYYNKREGNL